MRSRKREPRSRRNRKRRRHAGRRGKNSLRRICAAPVSELLETDIEILATRLG
jgi:hypothetical protein